MSLSPAEVKKIAHLARLDISETDTTKYTKELANILDLVAQMNAIDTSHIIPMAHPMDLHQRLRDDEITEKNQRELFQSIAPCVEGGLYLVPQVIE